MASPLEEVEFLLDGDFLDGTSPFDTPLPLGPYSYLAPDASVDTGGCMNTSYCFNKEATSRKRGRSETLGEPLSKACREKMRRDKLNEKFMELGSVLDPGKPPKVDKAALLTDASQTIVQLRAEAKQLKDTNRSLEEKIKELKAEKDEIREEKQRLKLEKENLEQQAQAKLLAAATAPAFIPPQLLPPAFAAQGQPGQKLMVPFMGYHPGFPMYQFFSPSAAETPKEFAAKDLESISPNA